MLILHILQVGQVDLVNLIDRNFIDSAYFTGETGVSSEFNRSKFYGDNDTPVSSFPSTSSQQNPTTNLNVRKSGQGVKLLDKFQATIQQSASCVCYICHRYQYKPSITSRNITPKISELFKKFGLAVDRFSKDLCKTCSNHLNKKKGENYPFLVKNTSYKS